MTPSELERLFEAAATPNPQDPIGFSRPTDIRSGVLNKLIEEEVDSRLALLTRQDAIELRAEMQALERLKHFVCEAERASSAEDFWGPFCDGGRNIWPGSWLPTVVVQPPHGSPSTTIDQQRHERNKIGRLAEQMRRAGWIERPLPVHRHDDDRLVAWAGYHRVQAARQVCLPAVPAIVFTSTELRTIGFSDEMLREEWLHQVLLDRLADQRPARLMAIERRWHQVRGDE